MGWSVPRMWEGRTAALVAGGPSLTLRQVHLLARAHGAGRVKVMAISDAVWPCWWADWLHSADPKWWLGYRDTGLHHFPGIMTTAIEDAMTIKWGVKMAERSGQLGFDPDPSKVRHGRSSACGGLHMLAQTGVSRILLLAVDMKPGPPGRSHWFGDHPQAFGNDCDYGRMIEGFEAIAGPLAEREIDVVNCSPDSALTCFRKAPLEELLR